jgi:hypothetical protein
LTLDRLAHGAQDPNVSSEPIDWVAERGGFRAGVERRADGLFQVHLERWMRGAVPEEPADWADVISRTVLSDNALDARELALEELGAVAPHKD